MTDAQFIDLARASRCRILVALPARLCVIERAQALGDGFGFLKLGLIGRVGSVVHQTVAFVVEARRCFRKGRSKEEKSTSQQGHTDKAFHGHLGLVRKIYAETARKPSQKP